MQKLFTVRRVSEKRNNLTPKFKQQLKRDRSYSQRNLGSEHDRPAVGRMAKEGLKYNPEQLQLCEAYQSTGLDELITAIPENTEASDDTKILEFDEIEVSL